MEALAITHHTSDRQYITMAATRRFDQIPVAQIIRIEGWSNYSKVYLADGRKFVVARVLKKFQQQLEHHLFIRAHNSHLVNRRYIHSYATEPQTLQLVNGECISVSRSKRKVVGEMVGEAGSQIFADDFWKK
jgi:two-component system LytT family response regulator